MLNFIKRIWNDPVGSQLIATLIIVILTLIYTFASSLFQDIDFRTAFINFWSISVPLWWLAIGGISLLFVYHVYRYFNLKSFAYDSQTLVLDQKMFEKITTYLLPQTGTISYLRNNNFTWSSFQAKKITELDEFQDRCERSDFEFFNPKLETRKLELLKAIVLFKEQIAKNTFPTLNGMQSVPVEWKIDFPEKYSKATENLYQAKDKVCYRYDELVKLGRRELKV